MRGEGLRKLQLDREAREREARELARLVEADDDDDDEELERVWRLLEAWEKREILRVDASRCELTKPKPAGGWPVVCEVADATDPALLALLRHDDIKKILTAGRRAMRTLRVSRASVTHADRTEYHGKAVVGYIVGCEGDGTPAKCVAFQKTLNRLYELGGNYAGSMELHCGLEGTLGMDHCYVIPVAIVEHTDRCLGEGGLYGAMVHATGYHLVGQCVMAGAPDAWAPGPLATVLANPKHDLYEYAVKGVAPPLMAPLSREEFSELTKEGMDNMSPAARKRMLAAYQKSGVGVPGQENYANQETAAHLARQRGFSCFAHLVEARECIQLNRKPSPWAEGFLKPKLLKSVAKAGLDKDEFWTVLPTEKKKGVQGFDIEGFRFTKEEGTKGAPHLWDWVVDTQRGPFPVWDVADALGLVSEGKPAPKLPWRWGSGAPFAAKELIERALAWSPPASEPSPPPAKKLRAAPPRRSTRLAK